MRTVTAKLDTMRKPRRWSVMAQDDGRILVQADNGIGMFDPATGRGLLNIRGQYFPHLHPSMGAKVYVFPADFIAECRAALDANGPETNLGGIIVNNTVKVV